VPFEPAAPTLYISNHSSFWDAIALNFLIHSFRRQTSYCMSDEIQVRKHPFFRRVGSFSVDRTNPRDGLRAIQFAGELLNKSPCAIVMYPQGKVEHNDVRPLVFERGIDRIIKSAPQTNVILVTIRYEFWLNQRPELMMDLSAARDRSLSGMAAQMTDRLDRLIAAGKKYQPGDRILLTGKKSISGDE
jgi:1-acyl-sn-glycerol-3-phosphate acyltransferase